MVLVGAPKDRSRMASAVSGAASGVVVSACLQPLVSRWFLNLDVPLALPLPLALP